MHDVPAIDALKSDAELSALIGTALCTALQATVVNKLRTVRQAE